MTRVDFIKAVIPNYLDQNGLVKTNILFRDSGNGVLETSIFVVLLNLFPDVASTFDVWYLHAINPCFKKPGLLMRTPKNSYGQESFDNHLAIAVACLVIKEKVLPRQILLYSFLHFGFHKNVSGGGLKAWRDAWLWRFPQVWVLMWIAAFPWLAKPFAPFLALVGYFTKLDRANPSGIQLAWLFFYGRKLTGFQDTEDYPRARAMLPEAYKQYYPEAHPFNQVVSEWIV